MYIKTDLQAHYPPKDFFRYDEILTQSRKILGENGVVAITDFYPNLRYKPLLKFAKENHKNIIEISNIGFYDTQYKIIILRSQEIPSKNGHLLAIGLPDNVLIEHGMAIKDTIDNIKKYDSIVIVDHPFYIEGAGKFLQKNPSLLEQIDALEGHNSLTFLYLPKATSFRPNLTTQQFYDSVKFEHPHLGIVASSDSHEIKDIGSSYTTLDIKEIDLKNSKELLNNLKLAIRNNKSLNKSSTNLAIHGAIKHSGQVFFNKKNIQRIKKMFTGKDEYHKI